VALIACLAPACKKTSGTGAAKEDLLLVPKDSQTLLMANITRMRSTAVWRKIEDIRDHDDASKKDYQDFVQKCGLDPLKQVDSVFVAVPQVSSETKEFAAILRGTFNEQKLVQCAQDQTKKEGGELVTTEYAGRKLYNDSKQPSVLVTFLDGKTIVVGGSAWIKKVIDLQSGKPGEASAKQNEGLAALMKRAKTSDAIWGAGIVPQTTRDSFKSDPNLSAMATMKDVFGSIDFASGFAMDLNIDTATDNDAKELVTKVNVQLAETRKNPQVMLMGLSTVLDGVKTEAKGPTFHLTVSYNQQQVDDLVNRIKGLLSSFGNALGGGLPKGP
jgi:hypothetical protein